MRARASASPDAVRATRALNSGARATSDSLARSEPRYRAKRGGEATRRTPRRRARQLVDAIQQHRQAVRQVRHLSEEQAALRDEERVAQRPVAQLRQRVREV